MAPRGYIDGIPIKSFDTATARAMAGYLIDKSPEPDPGIPNILIGAGFDRKTAIDAYWFMLAELEPFTLRDMEEDAWETCLKAGLVGLLLSVVPLGGLVTIGFGPWHKLAIVAFAISLLCPLVPALTSLNEYRRVRRLKTLRAQVGYLY